MTAQLNEELVRIATDYWHQNQRPILLSLLGERLSTTARTEKENTAKTLRAHISDELGGHLRIVHVPAHGGGVVPSAGTDSLSDEALAEKVPPPRELEAGAEPPGKFTYIVEKDLWLLFRYGLNDNSRAFVEFPANGGPIVRKLSADDAPSNSWIEVLPSDLPHLGSDGKATPFDAGEAIRSWAAKNQVELSRIQKPRMGSLTHSAASQNWLRSAGGLEALANGLSVLEPHEQARVLIPADILVNLIRRR